MIAYPHSPVIGNRYIVEDLLGEGGVGAVYRAKDRLTGREVALKRLIDPYSVELFASSDSAGDAHFALAQEFQILASLRHPNIIGVLDYGFDEQRQPYYTMDLLVNAQDIRRAARHKPPEAQVGYVIQILQALDYLHRRGIIHRDLKPANVLVKDDHVKVLDFGFATMANQAPRGTSGTLPYLAPEIFREQPASIASDLYAVGIIAYELLIGHHPFNTENVKLLVEDLMNKAPDLSAIGSNSPLALVVGRLLAKSPEDRYANAQLTIAAFSKAVGQPTPKEDSAIRESFLQAAPLIGRDAELAALSDALRNTVHGNGSTWLIGGESGVGKSRLLGEIATLALIRGALVLRGTGVQEGAQPFQIWLEALQRLVLAANLNASEASILKELIPEIALLIDRSVPEAPALDSPTAQQSRLLTTILAVFRRQKQPIVVMLDDLQWAGEESLALLRKLNAVIDDRPILILADFRDDEQPNLPHTLPEMQFLKLNRLSTSQITRLSEAMLGETGRQPEVAAYLERETEGNVFFLIEVVRALAAEAGQLKAIGNVELPPQLMVGGIQRIVERRIAHVPAGALPLLQAAAVFGRKLDLVVLEAIDAAADVQSWLTECANAVVLEVANEHWQFAHDKLREGVLTELSTEQRQNLHRQVAQAIELVYPDVPGEAAALTYHWHMTGNPAKEGHYARLAGEQALKIGAGPEAVKFFKRGLELSDDAHDQAHIMNRIAEALFWVGEFNGSRQYNLDALAIAREFQDQNLIGAALTSLGNTAIQRGEFELAAAYHEEGLAIARTIDDSVIMSNALAGLGDVAWRTGDYRGAMLYLQENLAVTQHLNNPTLRGNAFNMLGIVYGIQHQLEQSKEAFQQSLDIAQQTGDRTRMAQALSNLGEDSLLEEDYPSAARYFEQALALSQETGNRYSVGNVQINLGLIASATDRPEEARQYFLDALQNAYQIDAAPLMLGAVGGLARHVADSDHAIYALELIGLILHHPASSPDLQNIVTKDILDELKRRLPTDDFATALERGKTLDLRTAVEEILRQAAL